MKINSVFNSTTYGIKRGVERMEKTADNVAKAGTTNKKADAGDIAEDMVDLKTEKLHIKASLQVLKTSEELLGKFLDKFA